MIPRWLAQMVRCMLATVLMLSAFALPVMLLKGLGWIQNENAFLNLNGMLGEVIAMLPGIGEIVNSVWTGYSAYFAAELVEVSIYTEILYALVLFCAYRLMEGICSLVNQLFLSTQNERVWYDWLYQYWIKMTEVLCAVLIANLITWLGKRLHDVMSVRFSTWILMGIVVLTIFFVLCVGKKRRAFGAMIDLLAEMVIGMIVVCLIYIIVLCLQMMQMIEAATMTEGILILSGFIGSLLALELIESSILIKGISGFLTR